MNRAQIFDYFYHNKLYCNLYKLQSVMAAIKDRNKIIDEKNWWEFIGNFRLCNNINLMNKI